MILKQNTKFIWIYVAILFSFAIILILFAGLTQNNYQKEINDQEMVTAGIRKSLSALSMENEALNSKLKEFEAQNTALMEENERLSKESKAAISFYDGEAETTKILLRAYADRLDEKKEEAKAMLETIDIAQLTKQQKNLYDMIIGE